MSVQLLSDQQARERIACELDANLVIEAGAGTGKTTVLVDRVTNLLATGRVTADEVVVITFTEKAAAELSTRVRDALERRANAAEGEQRERLLQAARDLYRAEVETIHSFAATLLRERPVEACIDPLFEVLDELAAGLDFDKAYERFQDELLSAPSPDVERALALYAGLGYPVAWTSATTGASLVELRAHIGGKISLLTGPSGVGKSSLTNALIPGAGQRVGEISQATHKGRHTTTGVRLLALPEGGWLADSAGIRELALWNVPADELSECFVELRGLAGRCQYEDCQHGPNEDGCAFHEALACGSITPERYASFERLLDEARAEEAQRRP